MPITQLTTNGKSERPDISGNNIVWIENDSDDDVILFDGTTSTVLPDLGLSLLSSPQISPDGVFWKGNSSGWQFFFYDGTSTSQLTTNQPYSFDEKLSGNRIAWRNEPNGEHDYEVLVYDDSTQTITQLTTNTTDEYSVDISGSNVVWRGVFNSVSNQIILHNGVTTTQLTQGTSGYDPHVSGNQVVWRAYDGGQISEIYLYDGNTTTQLVDSNNSVPLHGFFDGNVVWSEWDGNDWELFRFDGTNTIQITDNSFNDVLTFDSTATSSTLNSNAAVDGSGNNLVWSSEVSEGNWEVFYYDGSQTIQVTNDSVDNLDPKISGNTLVWNAIDGVTSNIFKFEPDPDPDPNPDSFEDDFEPDIDNSQWQEISNGTVNSNFGGSGNSLFFTGGSSGGNVRFATSQALDLTAGGFISFDLIFGNSTNGGEDADPGKDVILEYSPDGIVWTAFAQYDTEDYTSWSTVIEAIPTAAQDMSMLLRWRQIAQSGSSFDNWGLDNVELLDAGTNFAPSGTDATFSLDEHSPNSTVVGTVVASDLNPEQILTYSIQSGNDAGAFAIDSNGQITVIDSTLLDYETTPSFNLEIEVSDNGSPSLSDTVLITVDLIDINEGTGTIADDFDPDIDNSQWQEISNGIVNTNFGGSGNSLFFTGGSSGGNSRFATSYALDLTSGGLISFDFIFGTSNNGGENADSGEDVVLEYSTDGTTWTELALYDTEDYSSWSNLIETIPTAAQTASTFVRWRQINHSGSSFDNWGLDNVELLDPGTNYAPSGIDATFSLEENSPNSTVVGTLVASDPNPGQILIYSIQSGNDAGAFAIDSNGQITVIDSIPLDYETTPSFNLEIEVSDNGSPSLSDTVSITVDLIDVYDGTGTIVVDDDLDFIIDDSQWLSVGNTLVNSNFSGSDGNSFFFTGGSYQDSSRYVTTNGVNVANGGGIYFDLIFGTSSNGGENADFGEDVVLEYSTDYGASWTEINRYDTEDYTSWTGISESIPVAAQTNNTQFQWLQVAHNGSSFDNWGLDNVLIEAF